MQKKYSHKRMTSTSLPCPLSCPCTACLACARQWVLDGELFTVQQGYDEGIVVEWSKACVWGSPGMTVGMGSKSVPCVTGRCHAQACGMETTFPEPLTLASVQRLNIMP